VLLNFWHDGCQGGTVTWVFVFGGNGKGGEFVANLAAAAHRRLHHGVMKETGAFPLWVNSNN